MKKILLGALFVFGLGLSSEGNMPNGLGSPDGPGEGSLLPQQVALNIRVASLPYNLVPAYQEVEGASEYAERCQQSGGNVRLEGDIANIDPTYGQGLVINGFHLSGTLSLYCDAR